MKHCTSCRKQQALCPNQIRSMPTQTCGFFYVLSGCTFEVLQLGCCLDRAQMQQRSRYQICHWQGGPLMRLIWRWRVSLTPRYLESAAMRQWSSRSWTRCFVCSPAHRKTRPVSPIRAIPAAYCSSQCWTTQTFCAQLYTILQDQPIYGAEAHVWGSRL